MPDQEDAWRMLKEIHEAVVGNKHELDGGVEIATPNDWPRDIISPEEQKYEVMELIDKHGPVSSSEIKELSDGLGSITRKLTELYYIGYVNRSEHEPYTYTELTEWGRKSMELGEEMYEPTDEQNHPRPWELVGIGKLEWRVLVEVDEFDGHPRTMHVADKLGYEPVSGISPTFTNLWQKNLLGRPSQQPYVYWLTDDGRKVLSKGRGE